MRRCMCLLGRTTGLDVEKMETKAREFTLAGDYRRILARPDDISWERISYKDPYADLQPSGNVISSHILITYAAHTNESGHLC